MPKNHKGQETPGGLSRSDLPRDVQEHILDYFVDIATTEDFTSYVRAAMVSRDWATFLHGRSESFYKKVMASIEHKLNETWDISLDLNHEKAAELRRRTRAPSLALPIAPIRKEDIITYLSAIALFEAFDRIVPKYRDAHAHGRRRGAAFDDPSRARTTDYWNGKGTGYGFSNGVFKQSQAPVNGLSYTAKNENILDGMYCLCLLGNGKFQTIFGFIAGIYRSPSELAGSVYDTSQPLKPIEWYLDARASHTDEVTNVRHAQELLKLLKLPRRTGFIDIQKMFEALFGSIRIQAQAVPNGFLNQRPHYFGSYQRQKNLSPVPDDLRALEKNKWGGCISFIHELQAALNEQPAR